MAIDVGRIVYKTYCDYSNNKMPSWEDLDKVEQDAWRQVAISAAEYFNYNLDNDYLEKYK